MRRSVVLVSGQLLDIRTWTPETPELARRFDLRFADHTRDDTISGMAERLLAESPPRFDLVAHALGGFVAFEVMRKAPERVASLALLATLAQNDGPTQTARREGYLRLVEDGRFAEVVEERIPILVHPARREDAALLAQARAMAAETGAETFLRQQRAIMGRVDSRPSLAQIACPTLIAWGRQDAITTLAQQEEMAAAIPGACFAAVDHCGHLLTLERPDTLTRLLTGWLDSRAD